MTTLPPTSWLTFRSEGGRDPLYLNLLDQNTFDGVRDPGDSKRGMVATVHSCVVDRLAIKTEIEVRGTKPPPG